MNYAHTICIDIETYRTRNPRIVERLTREAIEKTPKQNTRKSEKEAWDTEEAIAERVREALNKTAVNTLHAEVLCVAYMIDGKDLHIHSAMYGDDPFQSERDCLAETATHLNEIAGMDTLWVGHNIKRFDLSVLLNRWTVYGITPPDWFPQYQSGRWRGRIWDTMTACPSGNGLDLVSLDAVCEAYGLEPAKSRMWNGAPMDGSRVGEAYEAGESKLILDYCADDVRVEHAVYDAQIFGGTLALHNRDDDLAMQIREIREAGLTPTQVKVGIYNVLEQSGRIPA